jgi:GABA(A) receptor-associated protein
MYKSETFFQARKNESLRMKTKHPDRLPIIIEPKSTKIVQIDKRKFMVPKDLMLGQLIYVIRKRLQIHKEQGLFIFTNGTLIPSSYTIQDIYTKNADEDGFLYITYDFENAFG